MEEDLFSELGSNASISPDHPLISEDDDLDLLNFLVKDNQRKDENKTTCSIPTTVITNKKRTFSNMEDSLAERNRKNAIAARENRQKKKNYVAGLEKKNLELSAENKSLKAENNELVNKTICLEEEVTYLKSVLAHQSSLAKLIKNIGKTDIRLTSSFDARKITEPSSKRRKTSSSTTGGMCLHVTGQDVSLEFCSKCASMACGSLTS
ncbi:CREB/ATF bZIP transcription factor-like [Saccoglossus kowalevskii]|nr:PREDICTED: CREB/ATF bZIP transcription factor-like isoform X1 [Saccoglossus kowalevskii]